MNLNGKALAHIKELEQEGKSLEFPGKISQHLLRGSFYQLMDKHPLQRTLRDFASLVFTIAQEPGLADQSVIGKNWGKKTLKSTTAPDPVLENGREAEGIKGNLIEGLHADTSRIVFIGTTTFMLTRSKPTR
jgi:hypothetical protein